MDCKVKVSSNIEDTIVTIKSMQNLASQQHRSTRHSAAVFLLFLRAFQLHETIDLGCCLICDNRASPCPVCQTDGVSYLEINFRQV